MNLQGTPTLEAAAPGEPSDLEVVLQPELNGAAEEEPQAEPPPPPPPAPAQSLGPARRSGSATAAARNKRALDVSDAPSKTPQVELLPIMRHFC